MRLIAGLFGIRAGDDVIMMARACREVESLARNYVGSNPKSDIFPDAVAHDFCGDDRL
jgi:hypothetical protein